MTSNTRIDTVMLAWLEDGPTGLTAAERRAIADAAELVAQRRPFSPGWLPSTRRAVALVAAAVALVVAVSALASFGGPSPMPSVSPSASPIPTTVPSPSLSSGQGGCEPEVPARQVQWTGRIRADVAGMPVVCARTDPLDAGFEGIDIREIQLYSPSQWHYRIALAAYPPPASTLDRSETVIEYGFVFETTGDEIPDYVIGINNDAPSGYRVWVTDLATNTTEEQVGPPYGIPVEFAHPDERAADDPLGRPEMVFTFLGGVPWASSVAQGIGIRFYAWASVSNGPDVTAWDYAPDYGWSGDAAAGGPTDDPGAAFSLPYPAALWEQAPTSQVVRTPETLRLPTPGVPGLWSWTDEVSEAATGSESRIDLAGFQLSRGCIVARTLCVEFSPVAFLSPPLPLPSVDWIAFGLDVDADGDGDADLRLGMDNGALSHRGWFVDLATGEITVGATIEPGWDVPGFGETRYPWAPRTGDDTPGHLWLGRQAPPWQEGTARFRLWSAIVREGQLAGFDFSPSDSWLAIPPVGG